MITKYTTVDSFDYKTFLFETPLYEVFEVNDKNLASAARVFFSYYKVDYFNPVAKIETTYDRDNGSFSVSPERFTQGLGVQEIKLNCARTGDQISFFVRSWKEKNDSGNWIYYLEKIGQYPSLADFQIDGIKVYKGVLDGNSLNEFTKAIGLAAHGIGIGAFVYLRRIFERLVFETYDENKGADELKNVNFARLDMSDKITALTPFLPDFLVKHKQLYSILSKGVHELEEDECKQYFEVVKAGIELILDEKVEMLNKRKKAEQASRSIQQLNTLLKQNQATD